MDLKHRQAVADLHHRCHAVRGALDAYEPIYRQVMRRAGDRRPSMVEVHLRKAELTDRVLNQTNQLRKAVEAAALPGVAFDRDLAERVKHLRNLYEHWEQHRESFSNPDLPKTKSGAWYAAHFPDKAPWSSSWSNIDGFVIGGIINLAEIQDQVERVEQAIEVGKESSTGPGATVPDRK